MELKNFTEYLNSRENLFPEWEDQFKQSVTEFHIRKGGQLLYPGEVCKSLYFVKSGFFRIYERDGIAEKTIRFVGGNQFAVSIKNLLYQLTFNEGIICENDAIIFGVAFKDWLNLEKLSSKFSILTKKLLLDNILFLEKENEICRIGSTKMKYCFLAEQYPGIGNIVSQKNIASYLGVSPATLSNILKSLLKTEFILTQ